MASYIGVVDVDSKRPAVKEIRRGMHYFETVEGISEDNIYLSRYVLSKSDEDRFSLVKKPKNADSYVTIKKDLITGVYFLSNDEKEFVALYGPLTEMGNDLSPKIYVCVPIYPDAATATPHEHLITFPEDSAFRLTSVLSPDGDYAVVEERYISLWETPPRTSQRFLALNLKTRDLSLLYEKPHVWDTRDKTLGVVKWICEPGTYDYAHYPKVVNN